MQYCIKAIFMKIVYLSGNRLLRISRRIILYAILHILEMLMKREV